LAQRFSPRGLPAQPGRQRRRLTAHAVGSWSVSATSGAFSRVAMPPSRPSSVGPGRPPFGSAASSSS
jgi:hypothetical protein